MPSKMSEPTVLVVENENIVGLDIQQRLQSLGYEVPATAASGKDALEKIAKIQPDLVLMDIMLAGDMNGVETAEIIRERFDIPVVFLTAYGDESTMQRAKITRPFGYILKPVTDRELHSTVEIALYRHQVEEELRQLSQAFEQRNQELEEKERLLAAFHQIGKMVLASLNREEILDTLAEQIVRVGIFRSLMIALVDEKRRTIKVVRNFICAEEEERSPFDPPMKVGDRHLFKDRKTNVIREHSIIGMEISLDDPRDFTAVTAREGRLRILDGWGFDLAKTPEESADVDLDNPDDLPGPKMAYFIPIKRQDRVCAVLATGSHPENRERLLLRIEAMQPLLDQVVIALEHARLYEDIQREITERKQMEQEMVRLERLRAVSELAAGVSHNLNNMLVTVLGPAQLLERKTDDPELLREADDIIAGARRARDLVQRLNRAVRSEKETELVPVPFHPMISDAIQAARPRWKDESEAHGITIEIVTQLEEVPDIRGTGTGLHDLLLNLLFNAVDAMPEGGTITLRTQAVDGGVQLTVRDTGMGMEEETRRRVFEPFFTTKQDVGSGLGLSTVHGTVSRWGGRIEVESAPGQGATFTLWFPKWHAPEAQRQEAAPAEVFPMRGGRLLIVEDDEGTCVLLERLLSERHEVETVLSGREALERFAPGRYDVALIDLGMPGLSGDRVAQQMQQVDPLVVTVLITGWELCPGDRRRDVFDFRIQKPFEDLDEVEDVVAQAVARHEVRVQESR